MPDNVREKKINLARFEMLFSFFGEPARFPVWDRGVGVEVEGDSFGLKVLEWCALNECFMIREALTDADLVFSE